MLFCYIAFEGTEHEVKSLDDENRLQQAAPSVDYSSCTVVVRGFQQPLGQEMIELYFTNTSKSGGGEITDFVMREKEVYVVFTDHASKLYLLRPTDSVYYYSLVIEYNVSQTT